MISKLISNETRGESGMTRFKYCFYSATNEIKTHLHKSRDYPAPRTNADVYAPPATPVLAITCLHISSMTSSSDLENST